MKNLMKNTIFLYREWVSIKSTNAPAILMIKKACNKRKEHSTFAEILKSLKMLNLLRKVSAEKPQKVWL